MSTLIVFDWDDTICPTYELGLLAKQQKTEVYKVKLGARDQRALTYIEDSSLQMLTEAIKYGKVIIVTNATLPWVEESGRLFLPNLYQFIKKNQIEIISAYSEDVFEVIDWKYNKFREYLKDCQVDLFCSIGDSLYEKSAAIRIEQEIEIKTDYNSPKMIRTCKLADDPTYDVIYEQQIVMTDILRVFLSTGIDLMQHIIFGDPEFPKSLFNI